MEGEKEESWKELSWWDSRVVTMVLVAAGTRLVVPTELSSIHGGCAETTQRVTADGDHEDTKVPGYAIAFC